MKENLQLCDCGTFIVLIGCFNRSFCQVTTKIKSEEHPYKSKIEEEEFKFKYLGLDLKIMLSQQDCTSLTQQQDPVRTQFVSGRSLAALRNSSSNTYT